jgi:hypothetical protein
MVKWLREKLSQSEAKVSKLKNKYRQGKVEANQLKNKITFLEKLLIEKDNN